jgi:hypothetical protein
MLSNNPAEAPVPTAKLGNGVLQVFSTEIGP